MPRTEQRGNRYRINVSDQAVQAGQYNVVLPDGQQAGTFSMNYDRRESRLEFLNSNELEAAYPQTKVLPAESNRLAASVGRISDGRKLWQVCLIFALAFLAIEMLLIRFL